MQVHSNLIWDLKEDRSRGVVMVLAGKIFKVRETIGFKTLAKNLRGYRLTERFVVDSEEFELVTEITNIAEEEYRISGLYSKDTVTFVYYHGRQVPTPKTTETVFRFTARRGDILLTIVQEKWAAKRIAYEFSRIISGRAGFIGEVDIPPDALKSFHEENPAGTKVSFFEGMGYENIEKISLYGPDLIEANLFGDYASRGNLWYIVATSKKYGHVVGITRNGNVVMFDKATPKEYLEYVEEEIFPLIP